MSETGDADTASGEPANAAAGLSDKAERLARVGLGCSLAGLVTAGASSVFGILFGFWAVRTARRADASPRVRSLANGALVAGVVLLPTSLAVWGAVLLGILQFAGAKEGRQAVSRQLGEDLGPALTEHVAETGRFPVGTMPEASSLPVEQRLSWIASLAPYLGVEGAERLSPAQPWDAPANAAITSRPLPVLDSHAGPERPDEAVTDFVGMAGVGRGAALLPVESPDAGLFGYDRVVTPDDVTDGLASTIALCEVQSDPGPWGQGGPSTVRGLSAEPYARGGPDGLGRPDPQRSFFVLMADGSVRAIDKRVPGRLFRALATIAGDDG